MLCSMSENEAKVAYEVLVNDVRTTEDLRRSKMSVGSEADDLQKGIAILMSPLRYRPTLMFIGINPGAGNFRSTGNKNFNYAPEDVLEYLEYDYALAVQTRNVIDSTKFKDDFESSVKTNLYYTATTNEPELTKFRSLADKVGINYWQKANDWTVNLIDIVQPRIIICEGIKVFTRLTEIFEDEMSNVDLENLTMKIGDIHVVGYKRSPSICNQSKLIETINGINL